MSALIEVCRSRDILVIYTRHGHRDLQNDGGVLWEWWEDLAIFGTPQWEIVKEITPQAGELIIDKNRYSAFFRTPLEENLGSLGIRDLIVTGVMTNCCLETMARDAFMRDHRQR